MTFLAIIGAIVVGLLGAGIGILLCAAAWAYIQAAGGFIRARKVAQRYGVTLWKSRKPWFFFIRMVHWQAWNARDWEFSGLSIPWTFTKPIRRAKQWYPG